MKYTTIRIEGAILSADILDKIEQGALGAQLAKDFGFDAKIKVKDEIARAWADAQDLWRIFKRQQEKVADQGYGTTETRKFWMIPLLGLFGYDAQLSKAEIVNGKSYAISHRVTNLGGFPVHIVGFNDSLDRKREEGGTRMSPHALLQEYINLTENLYTIVTNGLHLRLLRDSSRLIKLSFIEFDLESMMDEEHFADFAIMYRLLHSSRMPVKIDMGADSLIERYHQDALDSGSRIREGLSLAVESSIRSLANGFLKHSDNNELRDKIDKNEIFPKDFYQYQLRLIYRLLFLMVIEERNLVFPVGADKSKREIYYEFYSVNHLRKLCEKRYLADQRFSDLWIALKNTFYLFESETKGKHLGLKPLAGDLFGHHAIGILNNCNLDNQVLLECLRNLNVFINKNTGQKMRVNYASLNVEEFGSVYEGLLEYEPVFARQNGFYKLDLVKGTERSLSGSHYTPDELVQPLIKHSLDYVIKDKLESSDKISEKEKALLSIKVCDVACGSGHILLNAARRIGTDLARVRTGEDQPSPAPLRQAVRDVIKSCIYGVDKNPLAVELCKVALWLEAHNPGEPLNFLDHHIKCGDAIVGLGHKEELEKGIANEAFKKMQDDEKNIRGEFFKRNKKERERSEVRERFYKYKLKESVDNVSKFFREFNGLPEKTVEEIEHKQFEYHKMISGPNWMRLKTLADIQLAQFFIPKNEANQRELVTEAEYRDYLGGRKSMQGSKVDRAMSEALAKRFFHYFLEFPDVFANGGFDCILGNPPYLGGRNLTVNHGFRYSNFIKTNYPSCVGNTDLVAYFLIRAYSILGEKSFVSFICTKSIYQGETRLASLEELINNNDAIINFGIRSVKWPGEAMVVVCLLSLCKKYFGYQKILENRVVNNINSFIDDSTTTFSPFPINSNSGICFKGSEPAKGFMISQNEADDLIKEDEDNKDVIYPYLNGDDLNSGVTQMPSRYVVNFLNWPIEKAENYQAPFRLIKQRVKTIWDKKKDSYNTTKWWWHRRRSEKLYHGLQNLERGIGVGFTSKYAKFSFVPVDITYSNSVVVVCKQDAKYFAILNSSLHELWAWKNCSTMGDSTLRYTPSVGFGTYPFPILSKFDLVLEQLGNRYNELRLIIMAKLDIGLTKAYNLFHLIDLSVEDIIKNYCKSQENSEEAYENILELRNLHKKMDETVLRAYGWEDLDLAHDFYEVDYLPENDRIRFTISPDARKEVLKRLLRLNHEIHEQEKKGDISAEVKNKKKKPRKIKDVDAPEQRSLF